MKTDWSSLLSSYQNRIGQPKCVTREACRIIERDGPLAYDVAQEFAEAFRTSERSDLYTFWRRVAANIAVQVSGTFSGSDNR